MNKDPRSMTNAPSAIEDLADTVKEQGERLRQLEVEVMAIRQMLEERSQHDTTPYS